MHYCVNSTVHALILMCSASAATGINAHLKWINVWAIPTVVFQMLCLLDLLLWRVLAFSFLCCMLKAQRVFCSRMCNWYIFFLMHDIAVHLKCLFPDWPQIRRDLRHHKVRLHSSLRHRDMYVHLHEPNQWRHHFRYGPTRGNGRDHRSEPEGTGISFK